MRPAVQRLVEARIEQGLPEHVEDEGVLAQVAQLLNADDAARKRRRPEPDHPRHRDLQAS
jgi:hypothetical protein